MERSQRYGIDRQIGVGAVGVVYLAIDRERGHPVAIKTLQRLGPAELLELKSEFRRVADVSHPNLAALYELDAASEQPFITIIWGPVLGNKGALPKPHQDTA